MRTEWRWVRIFTGLCVIALPGCQFARRVRISDVVQADLRDQPIAIEGKVTFRLALFGAGVFVLNDGTGSIAVVTAKGAPPVGRYLRVFGDVRSVVSAGAEGHSDVEINVLIEEGTKNAILGTIKSAVPVVKSALSK